MRLYLVSANICNHDPINIVGDLLPRLNRLFPANGFRWLRWPLQFSFMTPVKSVYLKFKIGSNHLCHLLFLCLNFTSPRPNPQQSVLVLAASWWKIQGFLGENAGLIWFPRKRSAKSERTTTAGKIPKIIEFSKNYLNVLQSILVIDWIAELSMKRVLNRLPVPWLDCR